MNGQRFHRRLVTPLVAGLALMGTSACCLIPGYGPKAAGAETLTQTETQLPVVTGSATYRERMMAPPGAVLTAVLQDTSRADAAAVDLAEWSVPLDGVSVPQRFTLAPETALEPRMTYTVRATIKGPDGALLWTTDTAHVVPGGTTGAFDIGELVMVKVAPYVPPAENVPALAGTEWKVDAMGATGLVSGSEPTLRFSDDGKINGSTGCNSFFGGYTQDGAKLGFTGVGSTKMACLKDGVMAQERTFTSILNGDATASMGPGGELKIMGAGGIGFTAIKTAPVDETAARPDRSILEGGEWVVEDINRGGVIDNSHLTLTFDKDGRVSGHSGCNGFGGSFKSTKDKVVFGQMMGTLMACPAEAMMQQEGKYLAALKGTMNWSITADGALLLTGDEGRRILLRR